MFSSFIPTILMLTTLLDLTESCNLFPQWVDINNGTIGTGSDTDIFRSHMTPIECVMLCFDQHTPECAAATLNCYTRPAVYCKCTLIDTGKFIQYSTGYDGEFPVFYIRSKLLGKSLDLSSPLTFHLEGGLATDYQIVRVIYTLPSVKTTLELITKNNGTAFFMEIRMDSGRMYFNSYINDELGDWVTWPTKYFEYVPGRRSDIIITRRVNQYRIEADLKRILGFPHRFFEFDEIQTLRVVPEGTPGHIYSVTMT